MNAPRTYAEWLVVLDKFREGDDTVIEVLQYGTIEWTNVVAERWTRQVADCFTVRLQIISKRLQIGLDRARGDYFAISNTLLTTRRELTPLRTFAGIPGIPPEVRDHLESELKRWITETQNSLERHAETVRHDQGRLLKTMRDHPLSAVAEAPAAAPATGAAASASPPVRGRRIIF